MVARKLQFMNGSYFLVIPRALIDVLGVNAGDKLSFGIEGGKITIAPAAVALEGSAADAASNRPLEECAST